ncbi:MAG: DUF4363 family protein [Oscillospiraceae bacterium]|nr:DUF4363 family protein [Candidatus Equicaccousia limihippi]
MSRLFISFVIFLVCVGICVAGALLVKNASAKINRAADELNRVLEAGERDAAVQKSFELLKLWENEQAKLIPFTPMKRIDDVNVIIYSLPQTVKAGEGQAEIAQIKFMLSDLYAAEGFNLFDLF